MAWIKVGSADIDAKLGLETLVQWLSGTRPNGKLGPSVVFLKRALSVQPNHKTPHDDINDLAMCLLRLRKEPLADPHLLENVKFFTMRVIHSLTELEKAARAVQSYCPLETALDDAVRCTTGLQVLMDLDPSVGGRDFGEIARKADAELGQLRSIWFTRPTGIIARVLPRFFENLGAAIHGAIARAETQSTSQQKEHRVVHQTLAFSTAEGSSIEVLCAPGVIARVAENIVTNVWKYTFAENARLGRDTVVEWAYTFVRDDRVRLTVTDNGPGQIDGVLLFSEGGGHANLSAPDRGVWRRVRCAFAFRSRSTGSGHPLL